MIILIAIVPVKFAIDHTREPEPLHGNIVKMQSLISQIDTNTIEGNRAEDVMIIASGLDTINRSLAGLASFSDLPKKRSLEIRRNILFISKKSDQLLKGMADNPIVTLSPNWIKEYKQEVIEIKSYTEYAPMWVILAIAISLGLGTMVGWKRIVVTIGEKIGKSHLTYAQGATAELIAAATITVSSMFGLPVSTTHVLSSGVAGTMVSGSGFKNLQRKTVASIGIAWLITLPVTMLFSGLLFLIFRMIFI
jgi:PiT family inorganic phosphate transporter